jgi:hypothetical protein
MKEGDVLLARLLQGDDSLKDRPGLRPRLVTLA